MPICSLNLHQGSQSEGGFVPRLAVMWSGKSQGQEVGRLVGWFLVLFVWLIFVLETGSLCVAPGGLKPGCP